ncbi:hypothetical protein KC614_02770 [candidate division WWE3 bacterium]|uniref:PPM-type phosphatase domain-containing protein n=1 Tax=candidate division WWE3 bacterium TaxID=2053526 RepID=A0A955LJX8_UNCKA|nr:hypothetical protein [candidate division WWE3 bacterium]
MDQTVTVLLKKLSTGTASEDVSPYQDIYTYEPISDDERVRRGTLIVLLELFSRGESDIDFAQLARNVFSTVQDEYSEKEVGSTLEVLEHACEEGARRIEVLANNRVSGKLGACAIWGKSLIYANPHGLAIGIRRNNEYYELDQPNFGTELIKDDDLIIIATSKIYNEKIAPMLREQPEIRNDNFANALEGALDHNPGQPYDVALLCLAGISQVPGEEEIIEIHYPEELKRSSKSKKPGGPGLFSRLNNLIAKLVPRAISSPTIYIKSGFGNRKRRVAVVAVILLALFGTVTYTMLRNKNEEAETQYTEVINTAGQELQRAEQLSQLNPSEALTIVNAVSDSLGEVMGVRDEDAANVAALQEKVAQITNQIFNVTPVEINATTIPPELEDTLLTVNDAGVLNKMSNPVVNKSEDWVSPVSATMYFDNIYVLDSGANAIWKYIGGNDTTTPQNYLTETTNLQNAIDLAIDGSVYVLMPNNIALFTLGKREPFGLTGVFPSIKSSSRITTAVESKYLFVSTDKGIAVFTKEGRFNRLYQGDHLDSVQRLVLNEEHTIMYVLADDAWWSFTLVPE